MTCVRHSASGQTRSTLRTQSIWFLPQVTFNKEFYLDHICSVTAEFHFSVLAGECQVVTVRIFFLHVFLIFLFL